MKATLASLAALTTDATTAEEYQRARTEWLEACVPCDMTYQGAVVPDNDVGPVVTGVHPEYTATCEASGDRYWADRLRLTSAARAAGGIMSDLEALTARERRERVFYREIMYGLGIRANAIAVVEMRGKPLSCIYFGRTLRGARFGKELERLLEALPILALGETVHGMKTPTVTALTKREDEIAGYMLRGLTNAEIGRLLGTSPATVKNQVATILRKHGVSNRTELAWVVSRSAYVGTPTSGGKIS